MLRQERYQPAREFNVFTAKLCYTLLKRFMMDKKNQLSSYFDLVTSSPERILSVTFFLLCLLGGAILFLPVCGKLSFPDALFTAVSAVCVTGLSVIDITKDLTPAGQIILLLLIQTGGLGIMSISSIIFIMLGKRMSLRYEKNARRIFDAESRAEVKESLFLIFKYTFYLELIGAILLTLGFSISEHNILTGLKMGIFSSISAFCNAGFVLNSSNLIPYNQNPIILYTTSFLIILGGISPAICVSFRRLLNGQKLPPLALIVFNTTIALMLAGTLIFLTAEYNGVLEGMGWWDKFNNSWFQSATLRTAGFNSVDLTHISGITYLMFIIFMIIGGSPGGTAGGIKTVVFSVILITCYNTLFGKSNIIRSRAIRQDCVQKSITLTIIYLIFFFISSGMLITTQLIPNSSLIFEAASALGTVGLTIGATPQLDEVGKMIIIITMYIGRVMPATIVYYMNSKIAETRISYPDAKLSLT